MAVVSVLLIVVVIALLAVTLMARQTTTIRAAQTEQNRVKAHWLLHGELSRVQALLRTEAQRTPLTQRDGAWARPVAGIVVGEIAGEPARAFIEVTDEQSKFNLRNLVDAGQIDLRELEVFQRLCALLGVPDEQASRIARRVVLSSLEADRETTAPPSPDPEQAKAALAAAQQLGLAPLGHRDQAPRLRDVFNLLAVPGIDAASVARLSPHITILPQRTWINANTAGPEVLAAWVPGLSVGRAQTLLEARDHGQWFINRGDFTNRLQMPEIEEADILIGITSQWFRMSGALRTPHTTLLLQGLLHDDKKSLPQVVWLREGA
ncbi:type II secretion system minor pseudopilin GspK [Comamonas sp. GB3 AK4-5]|uniref:type II secretion system minor pseudopilin GspK n=1 Tax=Comamonas sp. GB3 AK4-5 TaxID=3231487 RepID=UPI00351F7D09